jgi:cyclopropane-fatty-acyl-phospholipid synthase
MLTGMVERGLLPDPLVRFGVRRLLRDRLRQEERGGAGNALLERMRRGPIAVSTDSANEQHYEVPVDFYRLVLGPHLKYSSGYWPDGVTRLGQAEEAMLQLSCERAGLADGMRVLELGCGWGSLSLFVAQRYPGARIVAVSNSASQRDFILERARERGLGNLEVRTADINDLQVDETFDRVVSVEMFEHMRNYRLLLQRIRGWLAPGGKLFVHIFCHRRLTYFFERDGDNDWMARYFFTGGTMPAADLLERFQDDMVLAERWSVNGRHYQRTLEAWLERLDARREAVRQVFVRTYGEAEAERWIERWRLFFIACSELFGYAGGEEWHVGHYLLEPRDS